jgi:flagellar P-ring protein precursor FlgI
MNARIQFSLAGRTIILIILLLIGWIFLIPKVHAVRIKDITEIKGVRQNQLVGYGLVVGLKGTGDSDNSLFTIQSLASLLEKMGVTVQTKDIEDVENVAAVMVTAELPPFAIQGSRIDALVSSIGDAEDLQGGTLLFTPMRAADGQIYAVAQGPVSTGGFAVSGNSGDQVQKNFPLLAVWSAAHWWKKKLIQTLIKKIH